MGIFARLISMLFLALLGAGIATAAAKDRFALVIGNSGYSSVDPLPNPVRDAADIADTL